MHSRDNFMKQYTRLINKLLSIMEEAGDILAVTRPSYPIDPEDMAFLRHQMNEINKRFHEMNALHNVLFTPEN